MVGNRVTERDRGQNGPARETTRDGSRQSAALRGAIQGASPLAIGVTAAGLAAAVLLVATEFSTVASVDVASGSCEVIQDTNPELADRCELSGFERNGGSFLLLAVLAAVMAWGAGIGGSRPAAVALVVVGVAVLAWALLVDLPETERDRRAGAQLRGRDRRRGIGPHDRAGGGGARAGRGRGSVTRARARIGARADGKAGNEGRRGPNLARDWSICLAGARKSDQSALELHPPGGPWPLLRFRSATNRSFFTASR